MLGQVTSSRTMAKASNNHTVGVTADKNITWLLEQRVKSCMAFRAEGEIMFRAQLPQDMVQW